MRDLDTDQDTIVRQRVESRSKRQTAEKSNNRADQVRARHNTHQSPATRPIANPSSARANTQKPRAARYVVPSRPVVIRGTVSPLPVQKPVMNKERRQYKIALNTPGAEVRLPSISLGRPGWRILSGFVVVCMLAAIYALYNLPQFQFGPANVTGSKRVTAADISAILKTDGTSAIEAKPQELAVALKNAFHEFSSVSVTVSLPASLNVTVAERQPVLFWDQGATTLWVDKNGFAFPIRGDAGVKLIDVQAEGNPPSLVIAPSPAAGTTALPSATQVSAAPAVQAANSGGPFLTPSLVSAILTLGAQAPENTPVIFNPKYGLGWKDPEGWQVYFGSDLTDLDMKLAEYKAIVQQLNQQGIKPFMISVEFPHAPFYRLEK